MAHDSSALGLIWVKKTECTNEVPEMALENQPWLSLLKRNWPNPWLTVGPRQTESVFKDQSKQKCACEREVNPAFWSQYWLLPSQFEEVTNSFLILFHEIYLVKYWFFSMMRNPGYKLLCGCKSAWECLSKTAGCVKERLTTPCWCRLWYAHYAYARKLERQRKCDPWWLIDNLWGPSKSKVCFCSTAHTFD